MSPDTSISSLSRRNALRAGITAGTSVGVATLFSSTGIFFGSEPRLASADELRTSFTRTHGSLFSVQTISIPDGPTIYVVQPKQAGYLTSDRSALGPLAPALLQGRRAGTVDDSQFVYLPAYRWSWAVVLEEIGKAILITIATSAVEGLINGSNAQGIDFNNLVKALIPQIANILAKQFDQHDLDVANDKVSTAVGTLVSYFLDKSNPQSSELNLNRLALIENTIGEAYQILKRLGAMGAPAFGFANLIRNAVNVETFSLSPTQDKWAFIASQADEAITHIEKVQADEITAQRSRISEIYHRFWRDPGMNNCINSWMGFTLDGVKYTEFEAGCDTSYWPYAHAVVEDPRQRQLQDLERNVLGATAPVFVSARSFRDALNSIRP